MFCKKCGTEFPDGTVFCPNCATPAPSPEPVTEPETAPSSAGKPFPIAIIACVAAAILLIVALASCLGNRPKPVAKKYTKAYLEGKMSTVAACSLKDKSMLKKQLQDQAKKSDITFEQICEQYAEYENLEGKIKNVDDLVKALSKKQKEDMKDKYGKYSVSVKVLDSIKMDKTDLKKVRNEIKESYGKHIKKSKIKAAYEVEVEYKIKGKKGDEDETMTLTVVKYGMNWKVFQ